VQEQTKRRADNGLDYPAIAGKLFLKVNGDKSRTARTTKVKFLGYSFYKMRGAAADTPEKCSEDESQT